jgi:hypothetical protein
MANRVEFVSYDGAYPCLCSGTLSLLVEGKPVELKHCLVSGGGITEGYEGTYEGEWSVWLYGKNEWLEEYKEEIESVVNANIEWGCCGGCI